MATKPVPNETMLMLAKSLFARYDLPDGAQILGLYGRVEIIYVFIEGEGIPEMQQIHKSTGLPVTARGRYAKIGGVLDVLGGKVELRVQAVIPEDEPTDPSPAAKKRFLNAILEG